VVVPDTYVRYGAGRAAYKTPGYNRKYGDDTIVRKPRSA
jgi:hypothetical protein